MVPATRRLTTTVAEEGSAESSPERASVQSTSRVDRGSISAEDNGDIERVESETATGEAKSYSQRSGGFRTPESMVIGWQDFRQVSRDIAFREFSRTRRMFERNAPSMPR